MLINQLRWSPTGADSGAAPPAGSEGASDGINNANTGAGSQAGGADNGSGAQVAFTPEQQSAIARIVEEATKSLRAEAANYRTKLRETEAKVKSSEDAALAEQGKFKDLFDKTDAELKGLKPQYEELQTKFTAIESARRGELLERLPHNLRTNYEKMELPVLEQIVKDFAAQTAPVTNSVGSTSGAAPAGGGAAKPLEQMTMEEQSQLLAQNPALFQQLLEAQTRKQFLGA